MKRSIGTPNVHIPKQCTERLRKEYLQIQKNGHHPNIICAPLENNILEWHYVIHDLSDEKLPYFGGYYHGKVVFPPEYPFKPPSLYMLTPNGRFKTNTRLCMSMSDFHPETWNPMWSVASILTGLLSFMLEDTETYGSMQTTEDERRKFARESFNVNLKNHHFANLFPEFIKEVQEKQRILQQQLQQKQQKQEAKKAEERAKMQESSGFCVKLFQTVLFFLVCFVILYIVY